MLLPLAFPNSFLFLSSYLPHGWGGGLGIMLFLVNPGKIADLFTSGCSIDLAGYYNSK